MNYGRLFTQSWQLVWRHQFLWLLGLVAGLGSVVSVVLRIAYLPQLTQLISSPTGVVFDSLAAVQPGHSFTWLLSGTAVLFIISVGYWLAATIAQGAIIGATIDLDAERPSSLRLSLHQGVGLLGRFIAIDTLVFFPLFLLLLAFMLLATGGMLGATFLAMQGGGVEATTAVLTLGLICLLPLVCLLFPVGLITSVLRTLAFRETAVRGTGIRDSITHTWRVIRQEWGAMLVLLVLLWGIQAVPGMLLSLITIPLAAITAVSPTMTNWLGWIAGLGTAVPLAILHAFIAAVWTLAYIELSEK